MALPFLLGWLLAPYLYHTVLLPSLSDGEKAIELTSFNVFVSTPLPCLPLSLVALSLGLMPCVVSVCVRSVWPSPSPPSQS
jgi:hypothetical protein